MVDTIFLVGHWSKEVRNAYIGDLRTPVAGYQPLAATADAAVSLVDAATADAAVSRIAAAMARRRYRRAMSVFYRIQASCQPDGICRRCGCKTHLGKG